MISVRFGESHMAPVVCNANCDCDILLDYILRRAVRDTDAYARARDAQLRAALHETECMIAVRSIQREL